MNPMLEVRLSKVTLNMGAGADTRRLEASQKAMETISGKQVVVTKTSGRTTFGMPGKRGIGVKITLRGAEAEEILRRLMQANENKIKAAQFDVHGNFSFGIKEYIHIPGINYDPDIGILGLDVCVTLERQGYRVKKRRIRPGRVGKPHAVAKADAIEWARKFGFEVEGQ